MTFWVKYLRSLRVLVKCAIIRQHKNSFLGSMWSVIQPLIYIMCISYIFGALLKQSNEMMMRNLVAGLPLWNFFVNSLNISCLSLINRATILTRVAVPKTLLVLSDVIANLHTMLMSFVVMYIIYVLIFPKEFSISILFAPVAILPMTISVLCLSVSVAYITPYISDLQQIISLSCNILYWSIPIVYPYHLVPEHKRFIFEINPLFHLMRPLQVLMETNTLPSMEIMLKACLSCLLSALFAYNIHKLLSRRVVYYL